VVVSDQIKKGLLLSMPVKFFKSVNNWQLKVEESAAEIGRVTAGLAESNGSLPPGL